MAKKKATKEAVPQDPMIHVIQIKRPYADKEIMAYSHNMAEAIAIIADKEAELKEFASKIKDEIAGQEGILRDCAARVNAGYEMTPVECKVTYNKNIATFINKQTGEIVEKREMTPEEQLRLTSEWHDSEQIIRVDNEKDD